MKKRILRPEESRIVKQVILVNEHAKHGTIKAGYFFYDRIITPKYDCIPLNKTTDNISHLFNDRPEEDFPVDEIDTIILDAVKANYPKSFVRSFKIVSTFGIIKIESLKIKRKILPGIISFTPNFEDVDLEFWEDEEIKEINRSLVIYEDQGLDILNYIQFHPEYPITNNALYEEIKRIRFF